MTRVNRIDDFTFLTRDSFLLVRPTGSFEVYTFMEPLKSSTQPTIRATYNFPALADGYMYWYISMSSNPAPGYVPRSQSDTDRNNATPGGNRQIYYPNPDERIHACCLYVFNPAVEENQHHHDVHSFVFFLNIQNLLNPPAAWLVKKPPTPLFTSPPAKRNARNTTAMETGLVSGIHNSSRFSTNLSHVAPPNSPTLSSSSSSLFTPMYPPFPTFNPFPTHTSSPIPPLVNPVSSVSSSTSSSFQSGSPRTPITSLSQGVTIPWEVWGPQSTRWFEECISTDWQHAIYGLRTVESIKVPKRRDRNFTTPAPSSPTQPANPSIASSDWTNSTKVIYKSVAIQATEGSSSVMSVDITEESVTRDDPLFSTQESNTDDSEDDIVTNFIPRVPMERSLLRIRDFNPYSFTEVSDFGSEILNGKGKHKARWRAPRLVTETSKTSAKGVFTRDIESSLPYMEVVSEDTFEVTDVMMDDCRLLLLEVSFFLFFFLKFRY
jgi:hypothetical protein